MSLRPLRLLVRAAAVAATVAACSSGKSRPSTAATTTTAASPSTVGTSPTSASSSVPATVPTSTTATTAAGPTRCHSDQLAVALTNGQGAAGTIYSHLTFTNKSSAVCTMSGYPGVSFVDGSGHQIGAPVSKVSGYGGTVTLAAGNGMAAALFSYHDVVPNTSPECTPAVAASGLRVYPPGETAALFVPDATMACPSTNATGLAGITAVTNPASLPG